MSRAFNHVQIPRFKSQKNNHKVSLEGQNLEVNVYEKTHDLRHKLRKEQLKITSRIMAIK